MHHDKLRSKMLHTMTHAESTAPARGRIATAVAVALLTAIATIPAAQAATDETSEQGPGAQARDLAQARVQFNLPSQPLADSLRSIAAATNCNILFDRALVAGLEAAPLQAELSVQQALTQVLSNTDLTFRNADDKTVLIVSRNSNMGTYRMQETLERTPLRLAQADTTSAAQPSSSETGPDRNIGTEKIDEVIVTAQKRGAERQQDVPVPVTVLSAERLSNSNQVQLRDYVASVPGLNVAPSVLGLQYVTIRGITTGGTSNPTVGLTIDDVPFGSSTRQLGNGVPDIDPGELAQIEVLRGPQGTLFGNSSMGGLIRYATKDPSTDGFSGRTELGTSTVRNSSQLGHVARGSANIPVTDSLAVRVSGYERRDRGYVDNVRSGEDGVNDMHAAGGRLAVKWTPRDDLQIKLAAMYQEIEGDGSPVVTVGPGLADLEQVSIKGLGTSKRTVELYSLDVDYSLGAVDLTSITGYGVNSLSESLDYTFGYGAAADAQFGVMGAGIFDERDVAKFSEELRISVPLGRNVDLQIGAFFTDESNDIDQTIAAIQPDSGAVAGRLAHFDVPSSYEELAGFGNLNFRITDRLELQVGGRYSSTTTGFGWQGSQGPLVGPAAVVGTPYEASRSVFTYLVTPKFRISDDLMTYARFSSGYRPGAPNSQAAISRGATPDYAPDTTQEYEFGLKGELFNRDLTFDVALYYIDWRQLQLTLLAPPSFAYIGNGGRAKSQGVEASVTLRPLQGMTLSGWVSYSDAEIESPPPSSPLYLPSGTDLPYNSRWSGFVSAEQEFLIGADWLGFIGAEARFVDDRFGTFVSSASAPRQVYPAYTEVNLRAGVKYDSWSVNMYANNVGDTRGLLNGGIGWNSAPDQFIHIRPRTIGFSFAKEF